MEKNEEQEKEEQRKKEEQARKKHWANHTLIVITLLGCILLGSHLAYEHGMAIAKDWTSQIQPNFKPIPTSEAKFCNVGGAGVDALRPRLEQQYREIQGRMAHHLAVMSYFYANYFRAITVGSVLGAVSGICLFYIANKGWTHASNYVITVFVVSAVAAAFYLSFVGVFKEQENISDNKVLYLEYVALGNQLLSYCATGTTDDVPPFKTDKFVRQIDKQMATINNIAIGFDYTKIADYKAVLSNAAQSGQSTSVPRPVQSSGSPPQK